MAVSAHDVVATARQLDGNWAVFGWHASPTLLSALGRMVPPSLAGPLMSLVGEPRFFPATRLNRIGFGERGVPGRPGLGAGPW